MKKCQKCGFENGAEMNFCLNCGNQLAAFQSFSSPTEAKTEVLPRGAAPSLPTLQHQPSPPPPKKSRKVLWIMGALGLFGALGIGGFILLWIAANRLNTTNNQRAAAPPTPSTVKKTPTVQAKNSAADNSNADKAENANSVAADQNTNQNVDSVADSAKDSFTVKADEGWQDSEIKVTGGRRFFLLALGEVNLKGIQKGSTPEGVTAKQYEARRIYPEFPTAALLMRTKQKDGTYSKISYAGRKDALIWQNAPEETGTLEFCLNDNSPDGNEGEFIVSVVAEDGN